MSESGAAVDIGDTVEEECPLCLEPLPPFWDTKSRAVYVCCGKCVCVGCTDNRDAVLKRAMVEGTFGRQEEQLNRTCALCRAQRPTKDNVGSVMKDKFDKGQLPLNMYANLAGKFINGEGGLERNMQRGTEIWKLGAERGDPNCQFFIGDRYYHGTDGLPKSTAEAKRWHLAATEQGHAKAECRLAIMAKDEGNDAEYLRYLRSSASKGYDNACCTLGLDYYQGKHGLTESSDDAKRWFTAAAEQGHAKAEFNLANMLREEGNDAEYLRYLRDLASKGYNEACYNLGVAHWKGLYGLQRSSEEAIRVVTPAAERKHFCGARGAAQRGIAARAASDGTGKQWRVDTSSFASNGNSRKAK